MKNIEIKTPLPDPGGTLEALAALGARLVWTRRQRDTFYRVAEGYLKLREVEGRPGELIAYVREPGTEPRASDYDLVTVEDTSGLDRALRRSLGVRGEVAKTRVLYLWKHTRIHIDEIEGLGSFLELEAVAREISEEEARAEAERVIEALALDRDLFLDSPYLELLEQRAGTLL